MDESVNELIIQKLSIFDVSKLKKGVFAPHESTQQGLAEATGMNVASISRHLGSLRKQGIINSKLMNVQGRPRKVQCHYLTKKGKAMVNPELSGEQAQYLTHTPHAGIMDAMNRIAQEGELLDRLSKGKSTRAIKIERIQALNRVSKLYMSINQVQSALNFAVQAYVLADQLRVKKHLVPTLENLVDILRSSGNYPQAREYAQRIVDLDPTPGHFILIGTCVWRTGDYKGAIAFLEAAEKMLGEKDEELRFQVYNNLGTLYNELGDHELAIEYYNMYLSMTPRDTRRASRISSAALVSPSRFTNSTVNCDPSTSGSPLPLLNVSPTATTSPFRSWHHGHASLDALKSLRTSIGAASQSSSFPALKARRVSVLAIFSARLASISVCRAWE